MSLSHGTKNKQPKHHGDVFPSQKIRTKQPHILVSVGWKPGNTKLLKFIVLTKGSQLLSHEKNPAGS